MKKFTFFSFLLTASLSIQAFALDNNLKAIPSDVEKCEKNYHCSSVHYPFGSGGDLYQATLTGIFSFFYLNGEDKTIYFTDSNLGYTTFNDVRGENIVINTPHLLVTTIQNSVFSGLFINLPKRTITHMMDLSIENTVLNHFNMVDNSEGQNDDFSAYFIVIAGSSMENTMLDFSQWSSYLDLGKVRMKDSVIKINKNNKFTFDSSLLENSKIIGLLGQFVKFTNSTFLNSDLSGMICDKPIFKLDLAHPEIASTDEFHIHFDKDTKFNDSCLIK